MTPLYIFDLDGTLALIDHRRQGRVPLSGYPPSRVNAARLLEAQIARMVARCS